MVDVWDLDETTTSADIATCNFANQLKGLVMERLICEGAGHDETGAV